MDVPGHRRIYISPQMTTKFHARNGSKDVDLLDISDSRSHSQCTTVSGVIAGPKTVLAKAAKIQLDSAEALLARIVAKK